jgi:Fe2+ transport system protein FeoA
MPTLDTLKTGARCRVVAVVGEALLRERIVELGFTPGAEVVIRGRAPMGDPMEVKVRGGLLAIRRDEAACVEVADDARVPPRGGAPEADTR